MWWENFHSPQDDDQKWTGCSMLLTSWVPCCNQQASDGGWSLPSIFPHWLHIWIFHWNYSYSCSAFLKVMCSSWVTTGITAVILVPGEKHAYACTSSNPLVVDITDCSARDDPRLLHFHWKNNLLLSIVNAWSCSYAHLEAIQFGYRLIRISSIGVISQLLGVEQ